MKHDQVDLKGLLQIEELEEKIAPGTMTGKGKHSGTLDVQPCTIVWDDVL